MPAFVDPKRSITDSDGDDSDALMPKMELL
jgi:hypothetical protein